MKNHTLLAASILSVAACTETAPIEPLNAHCLGSTDGRPFLQVEYNLHRDVPSAPNIPVGCEIVTFGCEGDRVVRLSVTEVSPARACTGNIRISDPTYLERVR